MIGKVGPRGGRVTGLLYYLFGPGRCQEHTNPHLIAGWRHPAELEPSLRPDGRRDFRHLTGLLQQPHDALGDRGFDRPVWHCSVRAAPEDRMLSDDEWAMVAGEVMHRTGLAPHGQEDDAVRWVAVRHAADHIHIVAMLARQDGTQPRLWNDYYRVGEACRAAEDRFGLRATAPRDRTAAKRPTRAESQKAHRRGVGEAPRVTLRRAVSTAAAGTAGEEEFFRGLAAAGVLVRKRFSTRNPGQVTGYAVALPTDTTRDGGPVWYSGGKLAADLTLPKLHHRWTPATTTAPSRQPNAAPSTSTPLPPPTRPPSRSAITPPPTPTLRPTPPGPRPTSCAPQPRRPATNSSTWPPSPMTAPPACPTAESPAPPPRATTCAPQPGCCHPSRSPAATPTPSLPPSSG